MLQTLDSLLVSFIGADGRSLSVRHWLNLGAALDCFYGLAQGMHFRSFIFHGFHLLSIRHSRSKILIFLVVMEVPRDDAAPYL